MTAGRRPNRNVAIAFPAYIGRRTTSSPSSTRQAMTSEAMPHPRRAPTRGATSLPCAVAAKITAP